MQIEVDLRIFKLQCIKTKEIKGTGCKTQLICGVLLIILTSLKALVAQYRVQRDSWSWSWSSRLWLSRPSISLGLDRIFKSRPVLVLVSFEILFQDKSWSWSRLKFSFKTSLGIGLERQKNQDKINTKQDNNEESKNGLPTWWWLLSINSDHPVVACRVWFYNCQAQLKL